MRKLLTSIRILVLILTSLGALMAFLNNAIGAFSVRFGFTPSQVQAWGTWFFVISVLLLMLLSLIHDIMKDASHAKIEAVSEKPLWQAKGFEKNDWRYALYVDFQNVAPSQPEGNNAALRVSAVVTWKNMRGQEISKNNGRWHITNRQRDLGHALTTVDMYPNGEIHRLHIGITSPDGKTMFAWYRVKDEQAQIVELPERSYRVEIKLIDSRGFNWPFEYTVENNPEERTKIEKPTPTTSPRRPKRKTTKKQSSKPREFPHIPINSST